MVLEIGGQGEKCRQSSWGSWVGQSLTRNFWQPTLQEYLVPTSFGPVSVVVCGDQDKPALITYPDVGLNCKLSSSSSHITLQKFSITWSIVCIQSLSTHGRVKLVSKISGLNNSIGGLSWLSLVAVADQGWMFVSVCRFVLLRRPVFLPGSVFCVVP